MNPNLPVVAVRRGVGVVALLQSTVLGARIRTHARCPEDLLGAAGAAAALPDSRARSAEDVLAEMQLR